MGKCLGVEQRQGEEQTGDETGVRHGVERSTQTCRRQPAWGLWVSATSDAARIPRSRQRHNGTQATRHDQGIDTPEATLRYTDIPTSPYTAAPVLACCTLYPACGYRTHQALFARSTSLMCADFVSRVIWNPHRVCLRPAARIRGCAGGGEYTKAPGSRHVARRSFVYMLRSIRASKHPAIGQSLFVPYPRPLPVDHHRPSSSTPLAFSAHRTRASQLRSLCISASTSSSPCLRVFWRCGLTWPRTPRHTLAALPPPSPRSHRDTAAHPVVPSYPTIDRRAGEDIHTHTLASTDAHTRHTEHCLTIGCSASHPSGGSPGSRSQFPRRPRLPRSPDVPSLPLVSSCLRPVRPKPTPDSWDSRVHGPRGDRQSWLAQAHQRVHPAHRRLNPRHLRRQPHTHTNTL